jgi:2-polyprenyl-3-methyl-5-hydroxy-6-metoxy-1,4-benzoquinol methylase
VRADDSSVTVRDITRLAADIFADTKGTIKRKQLLRPYICPFHILLNHIPPEANILDAGCGAGLFIFLLVRLGRIRSAVGFDTDPNAIAVAQQLAARISASGAIRFEHRDANSAWPPGTFDVVSLIDVIHHIQSKDQTTMLANAIEHVADGGILLYKDMASRPLWRAWANRLHDLISAGDWIKYLELNQVIDVAQRSGLRLEETGTINMLWYRHEWCVFRRTR